MDEINKLLEKTGLLSIKDTGLTIVSLYGVSENKRVTSDSTVTLANRIVGSKVFSPRNEPLNDKTIEISDGLQFYIDHAKNTVYMFMDSNIDTTAFAGSNSLTNNLMDLQARNMKHLYFMFITSHVVIPILPPTLLPAEFLSTLVSLAQVKSNMYTHLAQYQTACWKHWNIRVPNALYEKREFERVNSALTGWWGPAKGVPILVFVATNIPFTDIVPSMIKKMQESLQIRLKNMFRALHLIPSKTEGNSSPPAVEVKSLFLLPSGSQPIMHVIPASPERDVPEKASIYSFGDIPSLSSYLNTMNMEESTASSLYNDYSDKLLRNFAGIWVKTAINRHPLHNHGSNRKGDAPKSVPLPTGIQFASAIATLMPFIFNKPIMENGVDFKRVITSEFPSTKGMIQQIEVILRKKIKDSVEIERVFSKSHSVNIMQKSIDAYLQDSPPYYTQKYHIWKLNNVMKMYRSLARGPCMEECALKLERECDSVWKNERQSCEVTSLTGKSCRLKLNHENDVVPQKQSRDERAVFVDSTKHISSATYYHACNCGKTQRIREDPYDIEEANYKFYRNFSCCLAQTTVALDIKHSIFGEEQSLVLTDEDIPKDDSAFLYLGPSTLYKNGVGLDKADGFMAGTSTLIPWSMTTVDEVNLHQQQVVALTTDNPPKPVEAIPKTASPSNRHTTEWPALGQTPVKPTNGTYAPSVVASLESFPALGTHPTLGSHQAFNTNMTSPVAQPSNQRQLFDSWRTKRRHNQRNRSKAIRGYVGAEYECTNGHRFFSCGEGRVCKLGHADHPKEHGNYFVHQDLPIYIVCPCSFAGGVSGGNSGTGAIGNQIETMAQLQRLYAVTPDSSITITMEPKIKINIPGTEETITVDLGIHDSLSLAPQGMFVMRLPFIYRDNQGLPIPLEPDTKKRLGSAILQKDCFKFHYKEGKKWSLTV